VAKGIDRGWHTSCQVAVVTASGVYQASWGDSSAGPSGPATRYPMTCLTKPVVATAVALAAQDGALDIMEPVHAYVPDFRGDGRDDVTLLHLLTHTAALDQDPLPQFRDGAECAAAVFAARPVATPGAAASFSAFANFFLLGAALEAATGTAVPDFVRQRVLGPTGAAEIELSPDPADDAGVATIRVSTRIFSADEEEEFLVDRGRFDGIDYWPGSSGIGTATAVATFFAAVAQAARGGADFLGVAAARALVSPWRVGLTDLRRRDDLTWGLGFVVDPRPFGGRCSPGVFSHTGIGASSFGLADPDAGVAVSVIFDCAPTGGQAMVRHAGMVAGIFADLADLGLVMRAHG
jgi:CubicO group peptidase (beta-lactamase class C family)